VISIHGFVDGWVYLKIFGGTKGNDGQGQLGPGMAPEEFGFVIPRWSEGSGVLPEAVGLPRDDGHEEVFFHGIVSVRGSAVEGRYN
jgi:hypothetical protein